MRSLFRRLLSRLALDRPELRAWAMYDWANSAFFTTVITAVFPIYFVNIASGDFSPAEATTRFAMATTIALTIVAVLAPLLGAIADRAPVKKKLLSVFLGIGLLSCASMFFIQQGDWLLALVLFVGGNVGVAGSFVFYDALLPHVARPEEVDRVSTAGYALGYVGGGLLLAINLAWIMKPEMFGMADAGVATRVSFLSVAVWWLVFSLPLLFRVPEPTIRLVRPKGPLLRVAFGGIFETLRELRVYRQATLFLVAFLIYNDGIGTIIRMATPFGKEIGLEQAQLITAILLVQFIGIPCTFLFGQIADKVGSKAAIFVALAVYAGISVLSYFMTSVTEFFVLAILVGIVQGGCQALSRSLFASMIPAAKSAQFFGLFAVFEKFAGIIGPAVFSVVIALTGSSRSAILAIIGFFVVGGVLLAFVRVDEGRRVARKADEKSDAGNGRWDATAVEAP